MKPLYLILVLFLFIKCEVFPINSPVYGNFPTNSGNNSPSENSEFADLWAKDQINKKKETAEVLTYLLNDSDPKDKFTAASISNDSRCDIILRLVSTRADQVYNLPVKRNGKNQFVIQKGSYTLKSNICDAQYYSQKVISDPLILKLGNN